MYSFFKIKLIIILCIYCLLILLITWDNITAFSPSFIFVKYRIAKKCWIFTSFLAAYLMLKLLHRQWFAMELKWHCEKNEDVIWFWFWKQNSVKVFNLVKYTNQSTSCNSIWNSKYVICQHNFSDRFQDYFARWSK